MLSKILLGPRNRVAGVEPSRQSTAGRPASHWLPSVRSLAAPVLRHMRVPVAWPSLAAATHVYQSCVPEHVHAEVRCRADSRVPIRRARRP